MPPVQTSCLDEDLIWHVMHPPSRLSLPSTTFNQYFLLAFEEAVAIMIYEGHTVDVISLDFAKAFDSVNYKFLLAKRKFFGFDDVVVRWIEAYLFGRPSRVQVDRGQLVPFQCTVVFRRAL